MNKNLISAIILILLGIMLAGESSRADTPVVTGFTASAEGQGVRLEWVSGSETGVSGFRLQRSFDGTRFHTVHTMLPVGMGNRYTYNDNDLFKGEVRVVYYRIEVAFTNNRTIWSSTEIVTLSFSNIRRTWGSIKAMFR